MKVLTAIVFLRERGDRSVLKSFLIAAQKVF